MQLISDLKVDIIIHSLQMKKGSERQYRTNKRKEITESFASKFLAQSPMMNMT